MNPYILCFGLPGSGKSTTAKKLENILGYIRFNARDVRASLGMHPFDGSKDTKEQLSKLKEYFEDMERKLRTGKSLIIDRAGTTEYFRSWAYDFAFFYGEELLAIWHDIPNEIAYDRIKNRPDEHEEWERRIKHNDPELRKKYELLWTDPIQDLGSQKYSHVSMIKYDTQKQTIEKIRVNPRIQEFAEKIIGIIL